MEIQTIKKNLTLSLVLNHYQLKPDKQNRLNCPFHDDKTPSMQLYPQTNTAYCFSSNCKTHGKSLDVIDFIMHMETCSKHEAILKAKTMITGGSQNLKTAYQLSKIEVLNKIFTYFKNGMHSSKTAREYAGKRNLNYELIEMGYNSGQFHHGKRKDQTLINACIKYGLLLDKGTKSRTGEAAYTPFGKWCICFPLKNQTGQITGLYFRSTIDDNRQRHFYLKDRQGLYPHYPSKDTQKLILTESIIDAATLLQQQAIKNEYQVLALYGTNGLTEQHLNAIKQLTELEEIIFFLNGDQAGTKAVQKYAPMLKAERRPTEYPNLTISNVQVPEKEDVNSLLQGHNPEILNHLIKNRKEYRFLFSNEKSVEKEKEPIEAKATEPKKEAVQTGLDTNNPYNLKYKGKEAKYQIKGFKINQMDSLKITLQIQTL